MWIFVKCCRLCLKNDNKYYNCKKKFKTLTVSQESTAQLISFEFHLLKFHPQTNK